MSRNKIIYGLSEVTVVVATAEGSGGTWAGATEAIKNRNGIVAVWRGDGEGPGNAALEARGARAVSDVPGLSVILHQPAVEEAPAQMSLLDGA